MKFLTIFFALAASCGSGRARTEAQTIEKLSFKVAAEYPHDPSAYTQGLFWSDGSMWESIGEYGRSTMRRVDLTTGSVLGQRALADEFFGEGAAVLDGKIYQLTWLEGRAFVYNTALERIGEHFYKGQGWGLTTDGRRLYMSDGTANISVVDPASFAVERTIVVRREGRPLELLNELEWIDGRLWANVYGTNTVVIIDPETGSVEAEIDFTQLTARLEITPQTDVMNGIAHDPATGRTWVTGKNWNRLFEVEVAR